MFIFIKSPYHVLFVKICLFLGIIIRVVCFNYMILTIQVSNPLLNNDFEAGPLPSGASYITASSNLVF